jgi:hypothetical protein
MSVAELIELLQQQPQSDHVQCESVRDDLNYGTVVGVKREVFSRDRVVIQYEQGKTHD